VQRKPEAIATSPVHVAERRTRATERSSPRPPMTAPDRFPLRSLTGRRLVRRTTARYLGGIVGWPMAATTVCE
jgi:hypothetical protein